ncbi:hypothetical protein EGD98_16535 [Halomicroarcula sp. F24A]|uniref:Uncharacterized protein n=2 Tax=Haloarcula salinisoli TaxID=2487746 RepID=A0A8J7YNY8_9EURY|nr:hypothetical protein [Halomicroarcula salinisoli]
MKRRKTLKIMAAAGATASMAGCSGILGGCGPGEDEIGTVAEDVNNEEPSTAEEASTGDGDSVSITGEIQSIGDNEVIIDDGTGTAKLTTLFGGFETQNVGEGDCAEASGIPFAPEDGSDNDIRLLVEDVGLANE